MRLRGIFNVANLRLHLRRSRDLPTMGYAYGGCVTRRCIVQCKGPFRSVRPRARVRPGEPRRSSVPTARSSRACIPTASHRRRRRAPGVAAVDHARERGLPHTQGPGAARKAPARAPRRRRRLRDQHRDAGRLPRAADGAAGIAGGCEDDAALDALRRNLVEREPILEKAIAEAIDAKGLRGAAALVRKLQFLDKLDAEIDAAYETIE